MRVSAVIPSNHVQDGCRIARSNGYGFERRLSAVNLFGCPPAQNRHRSLGVVPIAVDVQSMLDCVVFETKERQSLPEFEGAEESLDFSIETGERTRPFIRVTRRRYFKPSRNRLRN